jgi:hypothetical protein
MEKAALRTATSATAGKRSRNARPKRDRILGMSPLEVAGLTWEPIRSGQSFHRVPKGVKQFRNDLTERRGQGVSTIYGGVCLSALPIALSSSKGAQP